MCKARNLGGGWVGCDAAVNYTDTQSQVYDEGRTGRSRCAVGCGEENRTKTTVRKMPGLCHNKEMTKCKTVDPRSYRNGSYNCHRITDSVLRLLE
jgi:hypothetical protein